MSIGRNEILASLGNSLRVSLVSNAWWNIRLVTMKMKVFRIVILQYMLNFTLYHCIMFLKILMKMNLILNLRSAGYRLNLDKVTKYHYILLVHHRIVENRTLIFIKMLMMLMWMYFKIICSTWLQLTSLPMCMAVVSEL